MNDGVPDLGNMIGLDNVAEGMILPHQHTQRLAVPVSVSVELDDDAVVLRTETIHGSHVVYLLPAVAANIAIVLAEAAASATVRASIDTEDIARIERNN